MNFDIKQIPFSRAGSYMVISEVPADFNGFGNEPGIYLRTVHGSARTPFVAALYPVINGEPVEAYTVTASPEELVFTYKGGCVRLCFDASDTLLIKGEGVSCGFMIDLVTRKARYDYIYELPCGDQVRYMANCYKNNCKYLIWAQQGSIALNQVWNESTAEYSKLILTAENGSFLAAVKEVFTEWDGRLDSYNYEESRERTYKEFRSFYASMPEVPKEFEETRETASYINWSCIVAKCGVLTRPSMFMSKNWMTNVWSWDHCFNAIALSYNNPSEALNQFLLLFDVQDASGLIPDSVNDAIVVWNYCKPPIHGWALAKMLKNMELTKEQTAEVYEKLKKWTDWWFKYRDHDRDGICEYNHGNDSGWDNSTAFRVLPPVELPELSAYLALQLETLGTLAEKLGLSKEASHWQERSRQLIADTIKHFFVNNEPKAVKSGSHEIIENDSLILYESITLGKRLPEAVRKHMTEVLKSDKFLTPYGYATESPQSSYYQPDGYWRGPIWAPSTMLLLDGLSQCGEGELVKETALKFCRMIKESGCAENFDALTGEGLRDKAYTWTSSIFLILAHEYLLK